MPIPYHPRHPKPLAVPTEEDVAAAIAPPADDPAPSEELPVEAPAEEHEEHAPERDEE